MAAMQSTNTKVETTHVPEGPVGGGQPHTDTGSSAAVQPSVQLTPAEPLPHLASDVSNFGQPFHSRFMMADDGARRMPMTRAIRTLPSEWCDRNTLQTPVSLLNLWTTGQVNADSVVGIKHCAVSAREWEDISFLPRRESVLLPYTPTSAELVPRHLPVTRLISVHNRISCTK